MLFASTAKNLVRQGTNTVVPGTIPAVLNVYLRDLTNQTTALVSLNAAGTGGGNGDSLPVDVSADGRYVVFESSASDLVTGDTNGVSDVFVRDLAAGSTILVSVNPDGVAGNGASRSAAMTPDGRYVVFVSAASDLVPNDTNRIPDVFARDLQTHTTALVSVGARATANYPLGSSEAPQITPDGRYVAFQSTATNLVSAAPKGGDVYVRDLLAGSTIWASAGARSLLVAAYHTSNAICCSHRISADGQYVAYEAIPNVGTLTNGLVLRCNLSNGSTDLVDTNATAVISAFENWQGLDMTSEGKRIAYVADVGSPPGATTCVRLWDANTGNATLVSGDLSNNVPAYSICDGPTFDPTGQLLAFVSSATSLSTNSLIGGIHLYLRDLSAGTITLLNADTNGVGSPISSAALPRFGANGALVGFDAADANFVPDDRNRETDVFVRVRATGATELVSAHDPALACATPNGSSTLAPGSISRDGRLIAFSSEADDLVANDTNHCRDVFVRDLETGTTLLVSIATNGFSGDAVSTDPSISSDGRWVAFASSAANLVANDTNNARDIFIRDLQGGTTILASLNLSGAAGGAKDSYSPMLSSDGRYLIFRSLAANLAPGIFTSENLFVRDLLAGANYALTTAGLAAASVSADGRVVAFADRAGASAHKFHVWDSAAATRIATNATLSTVFSLAVSPDGSRVACLAQSTNWWLTVFDLPANTNAVIASGLSPGAPAVMRFDAAANRLVYTALAAATNQVWWYDFLRRTNMLISRDFDTGGPAAGTSDSPDISADGRFIAYRSAAADIVSGDTNDLPDVFLYDCQTGSNSLLSTGVPTLAANNRSLAPVFSGDGRTLFFQSWASALADHDLNHSSDLFSFTLFYALILPAGPLGQPPVLSWPWSPGANYRVQYKENLDDTVWHDLSGIVTNAGNKAYFQDSTPTAARRFYRILSF